MNIALLIPFYNNFDELKACLESAGDYRNSNVQVLLIDGGSDDGTPEKIKAAFPDVIVIGGDVERFWTASIRLGMQEAIRRDVEAVVFLNSDNELMSDTLSKLHEFALENPDSVVCSLVLNKPSNTIQFAGWILNPRTTRFIAFGANEKENGQWTGRKPYETDAAGGQGVYIPRSIFTKIDPPDDVLFPHYAADADYFLRIREAGFKIWVRPDAVVINQKVAGQSNLSRMPKIKQLRFRLFDVRSATNLKTAWRLDARHHGKPLRAACNAFILAVLETFSPKLATRIASALYMYRTRKIETV